MAGTITHQWNGTILTITSDSGTSACDLKGAKGDDGARGAMGLPGDANLIDAVAAAEKAANVAVEAANSITGYANAIKPTATGEVAAAADSGNYPLQGLSIYGKTTQAGTPTPTSPIDLVNSGNGGSIGVKLRGKNILPNGGDERTGEFILYAVAEVFKGAEGQNINVSFDCYSPDGSVISVYAYQQSGLSISNGYDFMPTAGQYKRYSFNTSIIKYGQTLNTGNIIFYSPSGAANKIKNVQIEYGTTATPYEPYKDGGSITLNTPNGLPGIKVSSGGNYTDSTGQQWIADEIDLEKGVRKHKVKKHIFDGSNDEYWEGPFILGGTTNYVVYNPFDYNVIDVAALMCDRLPVYTDNISGKPDGTIGAAIEGVSRTQHGVFIGVRGIATNNAEWRAWLANNPLTIIVPAPDDEPETPLTATEIAALKTLYSQYPNTTVYSDANAGIAATYVADTKLYIDNKFNELSTALVAMGG